ncbi:tRNA synthetases class I (E and Q), catalytic domain protein [Rickettsia amblyommatis str. Darkwater]|nr:tRNA synthetases class I (E and Q), catalytic domain protein [Rickettsia amblyommatis str. Darkwater]
MVNHEPISWHDMIKGKVKYDGKALSDPIVIRADGSMTYMLCSVIDDIDYDITHIIRGEDHVSNTAIQIQMFEALNTTPPTFGHLSLIINKDEKISKRVGGFEIATLRKEVESKLWQSLAFLVYLVHQHKSCLINQWRS